jgi:uncharacterized membrane protein
MMDESSGGMMTFPIYGKMFQTTNQIFILKQGLQTQIWVSPTIYTILYLISVFGLPNLWQMFGHVARESE